ncbi:MAG TPA: SLC13 family permease, partial [Methanomassiliicoccales archaeon]|nr:SLC13 family permease [Methanomassiliicoccales archaeon]
MCPVHSPSPDEDSFPLRHFLSRLDDIPPKKLRAITIIIPLLALLVISLVPWQTDLGIRYTVAILICTSMLWTFGMIPLAVTALMVPVLLVGFGIFSPIEALEPFADPVVYLLVGGLIIAETFRKNGMDRRLAYFLVNASGGDLKRTLLALMVTAAILSMWISNTATVALLIPVTLSVASQAGDGKRKVAAFFLIGIAMATAFGSLSTIIGSPTNAITSALLAKETAWTFVDWLVIGIPVALSSMLLIYLLLPLALKVPKETLDITEVHTKLEALGPLNRMEKTILLIFGATIILWVMGTQIASAT